MAGARFGDPAAVLRRAESGAPPFEEWVEALRPAWPYAEVAEQRRRFSS